MKRRYCVGCGNPTKEKTCSGCRKKRWRKAHEVEAAYEALKFNARRRKIPFALSLEEFEIWCGLTGYLELRGVTGKDMTIDRDDPTVGYTYANMRMLTKADNVAKANREKGKRPPNPSATYAKLPGDPF